MLSDTDVEYIKSTRKEIVQHRLKPFILVGEVLGPEDPYTGNPTKTTEEFEVLGTWTPMTGSGTSGTDYDYIDGVRVMSGDIIANVDIEYIIDGVARSVGNYVDINATYSLSSVTHAKKDGITYVVRAVEKLGLGEDNRYFILLRRVY